MYVSYHIDQNMIKIYNIYVYSSQKSKKLKDQVQKGHIVKNWTQKPSNQEKPSHQIYKWYCGFRLVSDGKFKLISNTNYRLSRF